MMINKRLINMTASSKKYMVGNVIYQWISLLCNIVAIVAIGKVLEFAMLETLKINQIIAAAIVITVMIGIRTICNVKAAKMSYLSSSKIKEVLREKIYRKLLHLGLQYPKAVSTSEVVQVSVEGVEQLEIYMGRYLPQFFYSLLAPITLFVFLIFINVKAAVALLLCVPLIPISIIAVQKFAKKLLSKYWSQYTGLGDSFLENLSGLTTLKIYGADARKHLQMNQEAETFRKVTMKVLTMQLNSISIMDLIAFGGASLGCIIAITEFATGQIAFWEAFIIIMLAAEFFIPLRLLGSFFHIAMNGMAASDKIFALLDAQENKTFSEGEKMKDASIVLENVTFSYDTEPCLKNVSMQIDHGSFTSIVGPSGSGKSTIAALINGEQTVDDGGLLLGQVKESLLSREERRRNITYVNFDSYIFSGTVRELLLQANQKASDVEMYEVLDRVNLLEFVREQGGLEMKLSEQGSNLSGGQKQRFAIARALLHDSDTYVFDEATSNIDVESEEQIMKVIHSLQGKKTVLFITHRLSQVVASDRIYVMKEGEVVEAGTFEELMEQKQTFYNMYQVQQELEQFTKGDGEVA